MKILHQWHKCGQPGYPEAGVLLLGHESYRILVLKKREEGEGGIDEQIQKYLLDPDLVICDEGHVIKNPKSAISQAVTKLKTPRRIILTGTPIQNNLKECEYMKGEGCYRRRRRVSLGHIEIIIIQKYL